MHALQQKDGFYKLLLVEDNAAHARLVLEMLRGTECGRSDVDHVTTLSDAIEKASEKQYDLTLLDLGLPESKGLETFLRFHSEVPSQPVVVLTSMDDDEVALKTVQAGAEDYLPKDAMAGALSRTIRHAVERARLNSNLHERENQIRTILSRNLDGLAVVDSDGKLQYANSAAMEMLNVDGSDRLMSHIRNVDNPEVPTTIAFDTDFSNTLVAEVRATQITWDQRPCYLFSLRDVTLRRQLESNLQQSQKLELIGTLAGGIAHDFNNILTAISGHTQMIEYSENADSQTREDLTCILDAIQRGNQLVKDLLQLGKPRDLDKKNVCLNDLLRKTEKLVGATIRKTHELSFEFCEELCHVQASPESLEQVIINLIMNSRDATEKGGRLSLSLAKVEQEKNFSTVFGEAPGGDYVRVAIEDNGSGMDENIQKKIFEPFFTTKDREEGTGLGMFVVSGIIEQHQGHIVCKSRPGEGTRFEIYLPAYEAS